MLVKGKIVQWDDVKGFGFIQPLLQGERVFLHIKATQNRGRRPVIGDVVTYQLGKDTKGRLQAQQVTFAGEKRKIRRAKTSARWPMMVVLGFFVMLLTATLATTLPLYIVTVYAVLSLLTFFSYWQDKQKARADKWRTAESTLHLLSLLGGWPGALLAQNYLRHKSQKRAFLVTFYFALLSNIALLCILMQFNLLPALPAVAF